MIYPPEFPLDKDEPAEEKVYNVLKRLDMERYDVFYSRDFVGMSAKESKDYEIDFIVAELEEGRCTAILIIEVKGGKILYDGVTGKWTQGNNVMGKKNPVEQAKNNMYNLIHRCGEISRYTPIGWAVCFPDPNNHFGDQDFPTLLNPKQLISHFTLQDMDRQLPQIMRFAKEGYGHLRGAPAKIYENFKSNILIGLGYVTPLHIRFENQQNRLIRLTKEQMALLNLVRTNRYLNISGPAGCGKTVMATSIAKEFMEQDKTVLLLTFNRIPAANIRKGLGLNETEDPITVDNYHRFARREIEKVEPGWWDKNIGKEDFWALESAAKLDEVLRMQEPHYDALIIDEAQDFREDWFESLKPALKKDGNFFVFMDEDQNIFNAFTALPKDMHFTRFVLPHNCRNTRKIIHQLENYLEKEIPCPDSTPEGEPVKTFYYKNDIEQARMVKDEWLRFVNEEKITPDRIVIILNTHWEDSCLAKTKVFGQYPLLPVGKESDHVSPKHVNITTIRTFKGLEADVVFMLDSDKMEVQDKRTYYTQASRARLWLGVFCKK